MTSLPFCHTNGCLCSIGLCSAAAPSSSPTRSRIYLINSFHDIADTLQSIQKYSTSLATSQPSDLPSSSLGASEHSICSLLTVLPLPSTSIASRIILQPNLALLSKHSIGSNLRACIEPQIQLDLILLKLVSCQPTVISYSSNYHRLDHISHSILSLLTIRSKRSHMLPNSNC
jgi:hypothetical protein